MTRCEFKERIRETYRVMNLKEWQAHACNAIERSFCLSGMKLRVRGDFENFISPFTDGYIFNDEYLDNSKEKLRMLLLKSFELEVLKTKRYLEY